MKTMSDFIMEQDIDTSVDTEVTDNEIMESFMRMNCAFATAECVLEHAMIVEFAEAEGLNLFTEASDEFNDAKDSVKNIGKSVVTAIKAIWAWVKSVVKRIWQLITGSALDKTITKLEKWIKDGKDDNGNKFTETTKIAGFKGKADVGDLGAVLDMADDFVKKMSYSGAKSLEIKNRINKFLDDWKDVASTKESEADDTDKFTAGEILNVLKRAKSAEYASKVKGILKEIDIESKAWAKGEDGKLDKETLKLVKEAAKLVAKRYDDYTGKVSKIVAAVLKKKMKDEKVKESAEVDTEGYNFL